MIYRAMQEELEANGPFIVIEGEAAGADRMARDAAIELKMPVQRYPADWKRYGRAAGPIRNKQMLDARPDEVWAFHANISKSKGTKNMVMIARKAGVPVRLFGKDVAHTIGQTGGQTAPELSSTTSSVTRDGVTTP